MLVLDFAEKALLLLPHRYRHDDHLEYFQKLPLFVLFEDPKKNHSPSRFVTSGIRRGRGSTWQFFSRIEVSIVTGLSYWGKSIENHSNMGNTGTLNKRSSGKS